MVRLSAVCLARPRGLDSMVRVRVRVRARVRVRVRVRARFRVRTRVRVRARIRVRVTWTGGRSPSRRWPATAPWSDSGPPG